MNVANDKDAKDAGGARDHARAAVPGLATALLALVTAWVTLATRRPATWRAFSAAKR